MDSRIELIFPLTYAIVNQVHLFYLPRDDEKKAILDIFAHQCLLLSLNSHSSHLITDINLFLDILSKKNRDHTTTDHSCSTLPY